MQRIPTYFLKGVTAVIGLIVLIIGAFVLPPSIGVNWPGGYTFVYLGLYLPAILFLVAMYKFFRLLGYIDNNKAFSELSVKALRNIKYYAFTVTVLFALGMPYMQHVHAKYDAPGLLIVGFAIMSGSLIGAAIAAILQRLTQEVINKRLINSAGL